METQEIAVPVHHSIVSEHELMVDGILFQERKEMVKTSNESEDKTRTVHIRRIGDKDFLKVTQTVENGEVAEESDSNLENDEAIQNFKNEWENEWHPFFTSSSSDTDETQASTGMANKIKNFFGLN